MGDSDTSTRVQTVWQVKLHKLEDGETTNINPNKENKWAPWISLENDSSSSKVFDLRIGSNNDGSLLEVWALSTQEPRKSRRQESLDPVKWEAKWQFSGDDWNFAEFDIASTHVGDLEIFYTFGIQTLNFGFRTSIRDDLHVGEDQTLLLLVEVRMDFVQFNLN